MSLEVFLLIVFVFSLSLIFFEDSLRSWFEKKHKNNITKAEDKPKIVQEQEIVTTKKTKSETTFAKSDNSADKPLQVTPEPKTLKTYSKKEYPKFDHSMLLGFGLSQEDANAFVIELIDQIESVVSQMEEAIEAQAYEEVEQLSHLLKGSAVNIGVGGIADVLTEFSAYCKTGTDEDVIWEHMHNLRVYHEELKDQFL